MEPIFPYPKPKLDLTLRCGLELVYDAPLPAPALMLLKPQSGPQQIVEEERLCFEPQVPTMECPDGLGNIIHRITLPPGKTRIRFDSLIAVPSVREDAFAVDEATPVQDLPSDVLRYILPSRYCDSDKLLDFSFREFGHIPQGLQRVQAICNWVHANVEYRYGAGNPQYSASDVIQQRFGVCRDFAHAVIALCRCFNIPARYVTGYVPDVAFQDPGTPMDFHAYCQVYVGHRWQTFDARFNVPRVGRVHIAYGLDAVDAAFSTIYGAANLTYFNVWAYQIDPNEVDLDSPVDLSKRLDGTPELRIPSAARAHAAA